MSECLGHQRAKYDTLPFYHVGLSFFVSGGIVTAIHRPLVLMLRVSMEGHEVQAHFVDTSPGIPALVLRSTRTHGASELVVTQLDGAQWTVLWIGYPVRTATKSGTKKPEKDSIPGRNGQ